MLFWEPVSAVGGGVNGRLHYTDYTTRRRSCITANSSRRGRTGGSGYFTYSGGTQPQDYQQAVADAETEICDEEMAMVADNLRKRPTEGAAEHALATGLAAAVIDVSIVPDPDGDVATRAWSARSRTSNPVPGRRWR
jgi:hypothetical protein